MQQIDNTPNHDLKTVEINKGLLPQQAQVIEPEQITLATTAVATIDIPVSRISGGRFRKKLRLDLHFYGVRHVHTEKLKSVRYKEDDGRYSDIVSTFRATTDTIEEMLPVSFLLYTREKVAYFVVRMLDNSFQLGRKFTTDDEPISVLTASELRKLTRLRIRDRDQLGIRDRIDAELNGYRNTRS